MNKKTVPLALLPRAILLFALIALPAAPSAWAQTVAGSISAISGSATIQRGAATIPAAYGTKINVGDKIVTSPASNVTITLTDSSQIEVTDSSDLTIDENTLNPDGTRASTKLSLVNGLVRSLVKSTPGTPPNYEVHTPNAVASARGTGYDVDHHTGVQDDKYKGCTEFSHVSVYQGEVQVYNPTNPSAPPVEVKEGQKVTIPCGLAPTFGEASLASTAALGLLGLLGAGAIAVAVVGATGGFGGHSNGPASPVQ
ncbi:MAG: FecR protein [Candidatus Binataceae bacterium]|nr:FecR protein [Candidatus Binataceae bacterium]